MANWYTAMYGWQHDQATIQLSTGGPPGSKALSLYVLTTSLYPCTPPPYQSQSLLPLPAWQTFLGNVGRLGPDRNLYVVLPDNTNVDITPWCLCSYYFTYAGPSGDPVTVTKYPLTLTANGIDLSTTNPTFSVGQQIVFAASFRIPLLQCGWAIQSPSELCEHQLAAKFTKFHQLFR